MGVPLDVRLGQLGRINGCEARCVDGLDAVFTDGCCIDFRSDLLRSESGQRSCTVPLGHSGGCGNDCKRGQQPYSDMGALPG